MFKPVEPGIYRVRGDKVEFERPLPVPLEDKDALIAQLRACLALLESREEKRRNASRETMRKKRAKLSGNPQS